MKKFDLEKWFNKFNFDKKKGGKNKLGCTKIAEKEQIYRCNQQKLVKRYSIHNGWMN